MTEIRSKSFQDWMQSYIEAETLPGMIYGIFDEDRNELFYHATSKENKYKRDTLFRIYSMTKPITGVALLILLERGLVDLNDDISKYIPAFKQTQVLTGGTVDEYTTEPLQNPITILHLLTHTSGITYGIFGSTLNDQLLRKNVGDDYKCWFHHTDLETLCNKIAESHLSFQPGTKYHYSLSTDVVGRIVEVVSGMRLDKFFQKEIFEPLGMVDTFFQVPADKLYRLAEIYDVAPGQGFKVSENPERERVNPPILFAGGGGLVSCIDDYSKFACCLLNHGLINKELGTRLLKEETVKLMYTNHLPNGSNILDMSFDRGFSEAFGTGFGFGLTVSVIIDPNGVKGGSLCNNGEFGWGGVAATSFFVDPVKKFTAMLFTQVIPGAAVYPIRAQSRWLSHALVDTLRKENQDN